MPQRLVYGERDHGATGVQVLNEFTAASPCLVARKRGESQIALRLLAIDSATSVALARAIYAPTKYVLLDDPLSAVDSHTARFLVEKLLRGPLIAGRTVVRTPLRYSPLLAC